MAGRITINGSLNELPQGTLSIGPLTLSPNTDNLAYEISILLGSGTTNVAVPVWAVGVIIIPNPSNAESLSISTSEEEGGAVGLSPTAPSLISFPASPPTAIAVTTGGALDTYTIFTFF